MSLIQLGEEHLHQLEAPIEVAGDRQVDVTLRKDAPVKTDTKASLKLKGITGVVFIELNGGAPNAQTLAAVTPEGQIPEIASEKSSLTTALDQLPRILEKFSAIEDQTKKVVTDVGEVTGRIKENPLLRLGAPKEKPAPAPAETTTLPQKEKAPRRTPLVDARPMPAGISAWRIGSCVGPWPGRTSCARRRGCRG